MPAGTQNTVPLDGQHNSRDVGIAAQDCPIDDGASLALWEAFRGEGLISAPAIDNPTCPPRTLKPDGPGPNPPLYTPELPLGSLSVDKELGDKSPSEGWELVQPPQLNDGRKRNTAIPPALESSPAGRDGALEGSTSDRAYSSRSAESTVAANAEGSDSDGPPLTRQQRRTRPRTRSSVSPSPPLTLRSSAQPVEVESTTALRRYMRL